MYDIRNGVIQWEICAFPFDGNSNVCSMSHHLRDIRHSNYFTKVLTLKTKVKVKKKNGACVIRLEMFDSLLVNFSELWLYGNIHLRKLERHTHTCTNKHRDRQG